MNTRGRFPDHGKALRRGARWARARWAALVRDGFQCVQCGARGRLEVDHITPVRDAPGLAYELGNLQSLCRSCHSAKTRLEMGHAPETPGRREWKMAVREMERKS